MITGNYATNIYLADGAIYALRNTVTRQSDLPDMIANMVRVLRKKHFNTNEIGGGPSYNINTKDIICVQFISQVTGLEFLHVHIVTSGGVNFHLRIKGLSAEDTYNHFVSSFLSKSMGTIMTGDGAVAINFSDVSKATFTNMMTRDTFALSR